MSPPAETLLDLIRQIVREEVARMMPPPVGPTDERTYSEEEFCNIVGICRDTSWRLRKAGKIKFIQATSRTIRYTRTHIDDFIDARTRQR
jgi:hypothetical protein